jgi:hypothetical protein
MDRRVAASLQQLSNLPPEVYARVAEVLFTNFSVPQPSIATTFKALTQPLKGPPPPKARAQKRPSRRKLEGREEKPHDQSRAARVRALLQSGPKTTAEILAAVPDLPAPQIHPVLASIGARPLGEVQDSDGDKRKVYGFSASLVREETSDLGLS